MRPEASHAFATAALSLAASPFTLALVFAHVARDVGAQPSFASWRHASTAFAHFGTSFTSRWSVFAQSKPPPPVSSPASIAGLPGV